jgi:uncharacterized protein YggE
MSAFRLTQSIPLVSLLGAALAATLFAATANAQAQRPTAPPETNVIVVTGEGSVNTPPDYAQIRGGVVSRAKTVKEATAANSKLTADIMKALLGAGIEQKDIRTSQFSIVPVYATPQSGEQTLGGFSVSNQLTVTVRPLARAGEILDLMVAKGATDIGTVALLHADLSQTLDAARRAAVADARRKAEIYAEAANLRLGPVAWLTEEGSAVPPMPLMRAASAAAVPIAGGDDTLHVRISVGFAIAR